VLGSDRLVRVSADMLCHQHGEQLEAWAAAQAGTSPVSELRGFAKGLRKDWALSRPPARAPIRPAGSRRMSAVAFTPPKPAIQRAGPLDGYLTDGSGASRQSPVVCECVLDAMRGAAAVA
jgi:hypothetical protein